MLSELFDYGAVATKVKAMYEKRLRPEDFLKMSSMKKVSDVVDFLKSHPGWKAAIPDGFTELRRGTLEAALRKYTLQEYFRIVRFLPRDDHFILHHYVMQAEMEQIMTFMRYARAGRASEYEANLPAVFARHSRIDFTALSKAVTYEDFLQAVRRAKFHDALQRLVPEEGGFPSYTAIEAVVRGNFFRTQMTYIDRHYSGRMHDTLKEAIGVQIDMININTIMRIRRFKENDQDYLSFILPVRYRLRPAFLQQLHAVKGDEEALHLLQQSSYGKFFSSHSFTYMEEYYYQFLFEFNTRHMNEGIPSVYTPVAYLSLRDVELKNLINVIEFVRYGISPSQAPAYLFGVHT